MKAKNEKLNKIHQFKILLHALMKNMHYISTYEKIYNNSILDDIKNSIGNDTYDLFKIFQDIFRNLKGF